MDQFIGQLQQKMQEFRIGVLRVEDVDEASGKIILTVSEADAAMYQQKKNASGQHCVLTQTTKTSPGFLLILQEHRERFFCYFSAGSRCFSVNGARGFHYANLLRCGRGRRS